MKVKNINSTAFHGLSRHFKRKLKFQSLRTVLPQLPDELPIKNSQATDNLLSLFFKAILNFFC